MNRFAYIAAVALSLCLPRLSAACACGCGVFEVGTQSMMPTRPGGQFWLESDYMSQSQNWTGAAKASADDNNDKLIRTNFTTAGAQYMFNRKWGFDTQIPFWIRRFDTTDDSGNPASFTHSAVGDMRLNVLYTGFSPNMASGLGLGLKLPTGDYKYPNFDRDTQIGTGSTDLLLSAWKMGGLSASYNYFANLQLEQPFMYSGDYQPGAEADAALGSYYDRASLGAFKVAPMLQLIGSYRFRDGGTLGNPQDSGYQRLLVAPGLEVDGTSMRLFGDVGFPVYQYVNGNQLVASVLYKVSVGYAF